MSKAPRISVGTVRAAATAVAGDVGRWSVAGWVHEVGREAEVPVFRKVVAESLAGGASAVTLYAWSGRTPCRVCRWCSAGLIDHCERPLKRERPGPGHLGTDSGCTERVPTVEAEVVPLGALRIERAAWVGVVARAMRIAQFASASESTFITLLGSDACTLVAAQVLAIAAPRVRVLAEDDGALERCDRWGIRHRALGAAGLRGDQDVVIVGGCVAPDVLAMAAAHCRPRGRIVLTESFAGAGASVHSTVAGVVARELVVAGVRGGSLRDAAAAMMGGRGPDTEGLGFEVFTGPGEGSLIGASRFGRVVRV